MFHSVYENSNSNEDIYLNDDATKIQVKGKNSEKNSSGFRWYRLAVVCLMMLVVLLLVVIAILWFKLITQREQLMTTYNNMTTQRDQLETSYNNLTAEKEQLQTSYNNLTAEKDRVAEERDQLQKKTDHLQKNIKEGWRYFKSSIYYISTETKNWSESRQDCNGRGADLVIITSQEEWDFVHKLRGSKNVWIGASDLDTEKVWKWVDGTTMTYTQWCGGEPDNLGEEDCMRVDSCWHDLPCGNQYAWICEMRLNV